jgi:DNA polymerase-3 subunit alpha
MSIKNFVHLHVHSEYSLLDGAVRIKDLISKASEFEMPAVALTDHGAMYGIIEFYNCAKKAGINPILGCEVYIAPNGRFDKQARKNSDDDYFYHLTLIAENITGYKNLMKLVSLGFLEGFYYKPRVDKDLLREYKDGLIALSGCIKGEIARMYQNGKADKARNSLEEYIDIFGKDNFFLEIQDSGIPEQISINKNLLELSLSRNIPLVGTNDVHYLKKEDSHYHDVLLCIQTGSTINEAKRLRFSTQEYYLKNYNEVLNIFKDFPGAIENTLEIAQRCNVDLKFNNDLIPPFLVPDNYDKDTYLEKLCIDGMKNKYPELTSEISSRLAKELEVIKKMGFSEYFLIVWDFVKFAKENDIRVGPGRGSAAGSIVSYLLDITEIEPIKYGLLFERFLNEARKSMPDIDIDFCYEKRNEVIKYVTRKYGPKNVAQLITFGRMAAKQAIRDAGRVLEFPYSEVDKIAKMIPGELNITIDSSIMKVPELREIYTENKKIKEIIDTAKWLEGMVRQSSIHAAGIVISSEELYNYTPIKKESGEDIVTQYEMEHIQSIGLLKMDFLGLKTLSLIDKALFLIEKVKNIRINVKELNLDDKKTFEMLSRGECLGVFQLESSGMRDLVLKMKPSQFEDLIALLALYRPGPLQSGMVNDYIENKNSGKKIKYIHHSLEEVLKSTYGMILYQEQVMQLASVFAGFSMPAADILRGAISKKKKELLEEQRIKFIEGAEKLGNDKGIAKKLFELINHFAQYGFNKSHSTAYAMISYQTAFLKANFPVEFMAALLSIRMGSQEKVSLYINECRRMGILVLPPDINDSFSDFTVFDNRIRFGLSAIKNVGLNVIEEIRLERKKDGKFKDFYDFSLRIDNSVLNKKTIESLIKGGAFDSLNHSRKFLLENFEKIIEISQKIKKDRIAGQFSLFDTSPDKTELDYKNEFSEIKEYKDEFIPTDLLNFEKEMLGLYITSHPLNEYEPVLSKLTPISDLVEKEDNSIHRIGGIVTRIKSVYTKKNQVMYYVGLEDKTGNLEIVVFPNAVEEYKEIIKTDSILQITGRLDKKEIRSGSERKGSDFQSQLDDTNIGFQESYNKEQGETGPDETAQNEETRKNFALKIVAQKIELLKKIKVKVKDETYSTETDENELKAINYFNNDSEKENINLTQESYFKTDKKEIILKIKKELLTNAFIDELHEIINENKGNTKINIQVFKITDNLKSLVEKNFYLPENFNVKFSEEFSEKIEKRFDGKILIE